MLLKIIEKIRVFNSDVCEYLRLRRECNNLAAVCDMTRMDITTTAVDMSDIKPDKLACVRREFMGTNPLRPASDMEPVYDVSWCENFIMNGNVVKPCVRSDCPYFLKHSAYAMSLTRYAIAQSRKQQFWASRNKQVSK